MNDPEEYPQHVIDGIKRALRQFEEGKFYPYTGIRDMLRKGINSGKERHASEEGVKSNPYFRRTK